VARRRGVPGACSRLDGSDVGLASPGEDIERDVEVGGEFLKLSPAEGDEAGDTFVCGGPPEPWGRGHESRDGVATGYPTPSEFSSNGTGGDLEFGYSACNHCAIVGVGPCH
jgi:hypothetical protein